VDKLVSFADVLKLNLSERLLLVEDLWDSIAVFPKAIKLQIIRIFSSIAPLM